MSPDEKAVWNERTTLTCTAMNNIAVAFVITGAVVPLISGLLRQTPEASLFSLAAGCWCFGVGTFIHVVALSYMRRIKA